MRAATLAEVFRLLASADASLAQIPQSHFVYVNVLRRQGTAGAAEVLLRRGAGRAAASATRSRRRARKHVQDIRTRLAPAADGSYVLTA